MSLLEWILIAELLVLAILAVMRGAAAIITKENPDDPLAVFCTTFWREFLWPPEIVSTDTTNVVAPPPGASIGRAKKRDTDTDETSDDDAFYGRGKMQTKTDLAVLVTPHAASDSVMGRDGDGIKIQVIGEAGESRSNKALVELIANAVGVKPFQVTLTKGHYQQRKTVQISGLTADELEMKLASLGNAG